MAKRAGKTVKAKTRKKTESTKRKIKTVRAKRIASYPFTYMTADFGTCRDSFNRGSKPVAALFGRNTSSQVIGFILPEKLLRQIENAGVEIVVKTPTEMLRRGKSVRENLRADQALLIKNPGRNYEQREYKGLGYIRIDSIDKIFRAAGMSGNYTVLRDALPSLKISIPAGPGGTS